MLANVPRRHVRHYKQNPIVLTPTSSTLPSPGPHLTRPDSDGEDGIDTLVSSSASPTKYKGGLMITIPGEEARKPLPPTFEFKSAQPILLDLPANQPRADCPGTTVPGLGLPKRRTLAQRFRERKERRCVQKFPVDAGSPWHLALADPNLDGLDIEAEEEGFDTIIRIFHTDPDNDNDNNEEERRGSRWRDNRRIRREGGRVRVCSGKKIDLPAPKSKLELSTVTGSGSREGLACTRTEIHLFIPKNPSDVGVTELTVAQMTFVSQFPDLGRVLLTTPPDRGVDALSLAAFCSAVAASLSSSSPLSPGEMIRRFNESLDTPLDISADEASWRWRGSVSWDGMEALDEVCTDDTKAKTKSGEL